MYSLVLCEVVLYRWSGAVEGWDVAEGFVLHREYNVADLDDPGFPLSPVDEGIFAASEREE